MAQSHVGINRDDGDWEWRADSSERARLLQSPGAEEPRPASTSTSMLGAVFIVVNAALGAGLLNFPAAFRMAGGVAAGIAMQMVKGAARPEPALRLFRYLWERLLFLRLKRDLPLEGVSVGFVRQTLQAPQWPSKHRPLWLPSMDQNWGAE